MIRLVFTILTILSLSSCSLFKDEDTSALTDRGLYEAAQQALEKEDFAKAIERYQDIEARYPFGHYAEQAQLEIIYAYYRNLEPEAAKAAAERFIRLHPQHPQVDYAYYLKALSTYSEHQGFLERFLPTDPAKRDIDYAAEAFNDFNDLLSRFPSSQYAADSRLRMVHLRNLLAKHEIQAADYYIRRGAYIAALNRAKHVVENLQGAPEVPNALIIMVDAYQRLELDELAKNTIKVIELNYPDTAVYDDTGKLISTATKPKRSFLSIITLGWVS